MNQKIVNLEWGVTEIVALLKADFEFTRQEEARIASLIGMFRDAFGRWRHRQQKRRQSN